MYHRFLVNATKCALSIDATVAAEHLLDARVVGGRPLDDPRYAARVDELASAE